MFDYIVEVVHRKGLLLSPYSHIEQLFDSILPGLVMLYKGIVLEGIFGPFNIYLFQRMRRQLVVHYVLGRDAPAVHQAEEALRIDQLNEHAELKLEFQSLAGRNARRVRGGVNPLMGSRNPEQLMRDIRNSIISE